MGKKYRKFFFLRTFFSLFFSILKKTSSVKFTF